MNKTIIYTDGGCEPNPGNGCWSFVVTKPYIEKSGHEESSTTSNRMEIMAVLQAAIFAKENFPDNEIQINSDSQYVVKGFNEWSDRWVMNHWKKKDDRLWVPVKNNDLWRLLVEFKGKINLVWVKGHSGNEFNEQCDQLVRAKYCEVFGGSMKY